MTYIDKELLLDDKKEHLNTEQSENIIDLQASRNLGVGENLFLTSVVTEALTDSGNDSAVSVTLETDDDEGFSSPTTAQTVGTFPALAEIGARVVARLAPDAINERYLRVKYTVSNSALTTGKFTTFISKDIDAQTAYPSGVKIS